MHVHARPSLEDNRSSEECIVEFQENFTNFSHNLPNKAMSSRDRFLKHLRQRTLTMMRKFDRCEKKSTKLGNDYIALRFSCMSSHSIEQRSLLWLVTYLPHYRADNPSILFL